MTLHWLNLEKFLINKSVNCRLTVGKKSISQNVLLLAAIDGLRFKTGRWDAIYDYNSGRIKGFY